MPIAKLPGLKMNYEIRGIGRPLILIMGLGSDHNGWKPHVCEFEKHFQCILVDNRGAGLTDSPKGPYTCETMARDVLALMDHMGIESAYVNGCSMGGAIAQEMAILAPSRVSKLVLTASFPKMDTYAKRLCDNFENAYQSMSLNQFQMLANYEIYSREYFNAHEQEIQETEQMLSTGMLREAYSSQVAALKTFDTLGRLSLITADTLIYAAEQDGFVSEEMVRRMAAEIPKSELIVVKGKGHAFHFEIAQEYNKTVTDFLKRW